MKSVVLNIIFLLSMLNTYGQLYYKSSNTHTNLSLYNPACNGIEGDLIVHVNSKMQWSTFKGGPRTSFVHFEKQFESNQKLAFGFTLGNDIVGVMSNTLFNLSFSYKIPLGLEHLLGLGLGLNISSFKFVRSLLHPIEHDPLMDYPDIQKTMKNASFGLIIASKTYYIGLSLPQLMATMVSLNKYEPASFNKEHLQTNLMAAYEWEFLKGSYTPHILIKYLPNQPLQIDLNIEYLKYKWLTLKTMGRCLLLFQKKIIGNSIIRGVFARVFIGLF